MKNIILQLIKAFVPRNLDPGSFFYKKQSKKSYIAVWTVLVKTMWEVIC